MTSLRLDDDTEISFTGTEVWVNKRGLVLAHPRALGCAARFKPAYAEVFPNAEQEDRRDPFTAQDPAPGDWMRWCDAVLAIHGVRVPDEARPA